MRLFRPLCNLTGKAADRFFRYGAFSPTPVTLNELKLFQQNACEKKSFTFLRRELPVRLANIMQEIHLLPETLLDMPSVKMVISWYEQSFKEIVIFEDRDLNPSTLDDFTETMDTVRNRHNDVVQTMAEGIIELKERHGLDLSTDSQLQYFLDRFYLMRISIRMLINQHVMLFQPELNKGGPFVLGAIDAKTDAISILKDSFEDARFLCEQYYLSAPELKINAHVNGEPVDVDSSIIKFVYVPSHLHHMCFELMKNAMRATMEYPGVSAEEGKVPYIRALLCAGEEDLTIKISDHGGGIPRSLMDMVFKYTYTTADTATSGTDGTVPLAGYGYGLPLSRLYARYFHGDLTLSSVEGYGTDAYIFMKKHATEADELLPIFNQTSAKQYRQTMPVADWSNRAKTTGLHAQYTRPPRV